MDESEGFGRLVAVWNGDARLDELGRLLAPSYRGYIGSKERDAAQVKRDIAAYRAQVPDVRFSVEHQFGQGEFLATRLTARAGGRTIAGLNMSRWEDGLLVEEWAVWETFA